MFFRKMEIIAASVFSMVFFWACKPMEAPEGVTGAAAEPPSAIIEETELFPENVSSGSTEYVFLTNDRKYIKTKGCTLWRETGAESADGKASWELKKVSGASEYGYGILFNIHDDSKGHRKMLCAMITITGKLCVGKVTDGMYSEVENWKDCEVFVRGFGNPNTLAVERVDASREFVLRLNGVECARFSCPEGFQYGIGMEGICAVVSPHEAFPKTKVEVHYKRR